MGNRLPASTAERILIVAPAWVGDMVMAQSLVARLAALHPGAAIDLVAPRWTARLAPRMPGVRRAHELPAAHGRFDLGLRWRTGRALRAERYDLAIVLPRALKAALIPFFAGIPRRRGWRGEMRYGLINEMRRLDRERLPRTVDQFVALAEAPEAPPQVAAPRLAADAAAGRAHAARIGLDLSRPGIVLAPGAEYGPAKRWPERHFAALAGMAAAAGYASWILGSPKEAPLAAEIVRLAPAGAAVDLIGKADLVEAIDLMALAAGVVSNDSGLMHMAAAVGTPLAALYGPTAPAVNPPLTAAGRVVEHALPCRPCGARECPLGHHLCLEGIAATEAWEALVAAGLRGAGARFPS